MRLAILSLPLFALALALPACGDGSSRPGLRFVSIGTGSESGLYYPTGGNICDMINSKSDTYNIKATADSTDGSVYNINAVLTGDLEFGIAQSDRQYQAVNGLAEWKDRGPQKDLRAVFSIHPEAVTLIAAENSGITSVTDLRGKRVNIGNPGSGHRQNALDALGAFGIRKEDFAAREVNAMEAPGLLQDERLDGFFYTVGHPNGNIKEATAGRIKVRLVAIEGEPVDGLLAKYPYYAKAVINQAHYPSAVNKVNISTFGVKATLITSSKVPDDIVYALTKEVFENLDKFKGLHDAYSLLTREDMLQGLSAPIHPGAVKYYREAGLMDAPGE